MKVSLYIWLAGISAFLLVCNANPLSNNEEDALEELDEELKSIKREVENLVEKDDTEPESLFDGILQANKAKIEKEEEDVNKDHIIEGDIMIPPGVKPYSNLLPEGSGNNVQHGDVIKSISRKWSFPIRYEYDSRVSSASRNGWKIAIDEMVRQTNGCFSFEEVDSSYTGKHLKIVNEGGCWSYIGDVSSMNEQKLSLASGCHHATTAVHELYHALGFWHEQSRSDRDDYINILWDNVPSNRRNNFNKAPTSSATSYGFDYDYTSVMHYSRTAFGSGRVTIEVKQPNPKGYTGTFLGRGYKNTDILSPIDLGQVKALYCQGPTPGPTNPPTQPPTQPPTRPPTQPPTTFNCSGVKPVSPDGQCVDNVPFCHAAYVSGWCNICFVQQQCLQTCSGPDTIRQKTCEKRKRRGWCDPTKWEFRRWKMQTRCPATCGLNQC